MCSIILVVYVTPHVVRRGDGYRPMCPWIAPFSWGSFEWVNVAHNQQPRVLSECGVDAICIRVEHVSNSCRIMSSPSFRAVTPLFGWYTPWSLLQRQSLEWYVQNLVTVLVPHHILICQVARSTCGRALMYHTSCFKLLAVGCCVESLLFLFCLI